MPTADFFPLDIRDNTNPVAESSEVLPLGDVVEGLGYGDTEKDAPNNDLFIVYSVAGGPVRGDLIIDARALLEHTDTMRGSPFSFSCELYELDPEHEFNEWYSAGGITPARWRACHHLDCSYQIHVRPANPFAHAIVGVDGDPPIALRKLAPVSGQSLGPYHEIGQYQAIDTTELLSHVLWTLTRRGSGWGAESIWIECWKAKAGGGGKYNFEPDVLLGTSEKRTIATMDLDTEALFTFLFLGGQQVDFGANGDDYVFVLTCDYSQSTVNYVDVKNGGSADGDNEVTGRDSAFMAFGQENRLAPSNYLDSLTLADVAIGLGTESNFWQEAAGLPAGTISDGGTFGAFGFVVQRALERSGWDANPRFGLWFNTSATLSGVAIYPALQGTPGRINPTLRLNWIAWVPPTITNLPPPELQGRVFIGNSFAFTATGNSVTLRTLVWSITDPPAGLGGPATINPSTGAISWTPLHTGVVTLKITVSDDIGAGQTVEFFVRCLPIKAPLALVAPLEVDRPGRPLEVVSAAVGELVVGSASRADLEIVAASPGKPGVLPASSSDVMIGPASPGELEVEEAEPE